MPATSSLSSLSNLFSLQRMLRRNSVDRLVIILKVILVGATFWGVWFLFEEFFKNYLSAGAEVQKIDNEIQSRLEKNKPGTSSTGHKRDYNVIATRNLLGPLATPTAAPAPRASLKPPSNVQLSLIGTFVTDGQAPYAIIEDSKKNQQDVFVVNESIFGDSKLLTIQSDRVEIERNGQKEWLVLDDLPGAGTAPQYKDGIAQAENNLYYVQEAELDKALENLPLLLTQARAVPYFKDGKSVGLRLFAIKSDSIYEKVGLRNADILKSINGNSLADLSQAIKLFETLKQERSITINLERNSEEKEFKYEIR